MNDTVIAALITAGGSTLVAITALRLNYRAFASIDNRFSSLEASVNSRFASVEHRLDIIQAGVKEFYRILAEHDKRLSRLEDKQ